MRPGGGRLVRLQARDCAVLLVISLIASPSAVSAGDTVLDELRRNNYSIGLFWHLQVHLRPFAGKELRRQVDLGQLDEKDLSRAHSERIVCGGTAVTFLIDQPTGWTNYVAGSRGLLFETKQSVIRLSEVGVNCRANEIALVGRLRPADEVGLWTIRADEPPRLVCSLPNNGKPFANRISYSPDGLRLAFDWEGFVWLADTATKHCERRFDGIQPSWSPVGDLIAFQGRNDVGYLVNLRTGEKRVFTKTAMAGNTPIHWSPDGEFLLYNDLSSVKIPYYSSWFRLYRLRDGASKRWQNTGGARGLDYGWIADWRDWTHTDRP
jgi:hypothetical protein